MLANDMTSFHKTQLQEIMLKDLVPAQTGQAGRLQEETRQSRNIDCWSRTRVASAKNIRMSEQGINTCLQ
jgi:hypothetical protein